MEDIDLIMVFFNIDNISIQLTSVIATTLKFGYAINLTSGIPETVCPLIHKASE